MIIGITGHRPQRLKGQQKLIKEWSKQQLINLKPSLLYTGMAEGTDRIIAIAAKELNIPIVCCYPFPKKYYSPIEEWIMENNQIVYISPVYMKNSYFLRDRFIVDQSDIILCVWDGKGGGGTFFTRNYALQKNKKIIDYKGLMI